MYFHVILLSHDDDDDDDDDDEEAFRSRKKIYLPKKVLAIKSKVPDICRNFDKLQ